MANYNTLKSAVADVVKTNGNNEITGQLLQQTLFAIINSLGADYQFAGVAMTSTNPGTPDQNVFYITGESGIFPNFNNISVDEDTVAILKYNGAWTKEETNAFAKGGADIFANEIGTNTLARLIDGGATQFEQGEITNSGGNTQNKAFIRFAQAIKTPKLLAVPDGYVITSVFYYSSWTDAQTFTFSQRVAVNARNASLDTTKPYVRIVVRRDDSARMTVAEFLVALYAESYRLFELLPLELQRSYNYDTNDGTAVESANASISQIIPYVANPYTNIPSAGFTYNALYWSNGVYLGYSTNSYDGPTTWISADHSLPITHIAFGLYGIPTDALYYRHPNPEIIANGEQTLAKAKESIKEADFNRVVTYGSVYNDQNGVIIALANYSRTDKFPFLQNAKTNAMDFPVGSCETLYWSNGTYLGYTQNMPYQDTPAVWIAADHSLPVTHVAFCWNSLEIANVYYIVDSGVFVDSAFVNNKVAQLKTYSDEQDNLIRSSLAGTQEDVTALQGALGEVVGDVEQIQQDVETINDALDDLTGELPPGAVTGNNVWTGTNQFAQPITGVGATAENQLTTLSQLHNASTANRFVDAKDFGFLPTNDASTNTTALNNAVQNGNKTVVVSQPGTYKVNNTIVLYDNTTLVFGNGVTIQKDAAYQNMFRNAGATTRSYNRNICIFGLVLSINNKGMANDVDGAIFGLRGELGFLCTENVRIRDFRCEDLYTGAYAIQFNQSSNFVIEDFVIRGQKDGVHISSVDNFVIRNGVFETKDDALALNACDWVSSNCVDGDIRDGLVESVVDVAPSFAQDGYSCRLLTGAWKNWQSGMSIHRGDTVVSNNKIYRAYTENPTNDIYTSGTQPTIATFTGKQQDTGGFYWKLMRDDAVYYSANIENVVFRNCRFEANRAGFVEEVDTNNSYNRSLYPGLQYSDYPRVNIAVEDYSFANNNYEPFSTSGNTHTYLRLCGLCGTGATIKFDAPVDASLTKRMDARNVDFRKFAGLSANVRTGADTELHLNDCVKASAITLSSAGRVIGNCNLSALPTGPAQGDFVIHNHTPKIYNGSSWVSLI